MRTQSRRPRRPTSETDINGWTMNSGSVKGCSGVAYLLVTELRRDEKETGLEDT